MEQATVTRIDEASIIVKCRCNDEHTVTVNEKDELVLTTKEGKPDAPPAPKAKTLLKFSGR
jgi:hypothetical protein